MSESTSGLGKTYNRIYEFICGSHPNQRLWHFQWLSATLLQQDLEKILPSLSGTVLDVGCGEKPYDYLLNHAENHVGIDVVAGPEVDHIVGPTDPWPFADDSIDNVIATQVLEHTEQYEYTLAEVQRVIKPGGQVVLSFPFLYNEHGSPHDFQRFSAHRAATLLPELTLDEVIIQGGIGSTVATLVLNWIDTTLGLTFLTRLLKALLLPLSIPVNTIVNCLAWLLDRADKTNAFYSNVLVIFKAPSV
jgi:SAM-dependent methyltransferase